MRLSVRTNVFALLLAVISCAVAVHAVAQAPSPKVQPRPGPTSPAPAQAPAQSSGPSLPSSVQSPGRLGMGALLEQFTTLEDRDISVLVTSGDETTLSSQMAGKIKKINYGLGDNIGIRQVLLEFDCEEQDAQLQSAEAEYRGARETH